jgi:hypothetical protein
MESYFLACTVHTESTYKYLKVEYLCKIKIFFKKSRVTGPWDHKDLDAKKQRKQIYHACVPLSWVVQNSHLYKCSLYIKTLNLLLCFGKLGAYFDI